MSEPYKHPRLAFELHFPGTFVTSEKGYLRAVDNAISSAASALCEAALALTFIEELGLMGIPEHDWAAEGAIAQEFYQLQEQVLKERGVGVDDPHDHVVHDAAAFEASRRFLHKYYVAGILPDQIAQSRLPLFAKSFLFAVNEVGAHLSTLLEAGDMPKNVRLVIKSFYKAFPDLVAMRDSAAHPEDRLRRLAKKKRSKQRIPQQPGPFGHLHYGSLFDSRLVFTTAAGNQGVLDLTWDTVRIAADHIQDVIDAVPWEGRPHVYPNALKH